MIHYMDTCNIYYCTSTIFQCKKKAAVLNLGLQELTQGGGSGLENLMPGATPEIRHIRLLRGGTQISVLLKVPLVVSGEGNGSPLQCSCLENPMDGGAW